MTPAAILPRGDDRNAVPTILGRQEFDSMGEGHEETVIGFLMTYPDTIPEFSGMVGPELFLHPKNRRILQALSELMATSTPISLISVTDHLCRAGFLEEAGGRSYLTHLAGDFFIGRAAFTYALDELREAAARRAVSDVGKRMMTGELTPEAAISALQSANAQAGRQGQGLTVRSAEEIRTMTLDEHDCLLGDRLLAKGQPLVIAGAGGLGKSRLLLQLAAACIIGRPWCGLETRARGLRWLVLQSENSNRRLQHDLRALEKWCGAQWSEVGGSLYLHTLEGDRDGILSLADPNVVRWISLIIQQIQPDIVAIDPLRDLMIGDPNSDVDMSATVSAIGALCRRGNKQRAIVLLHHALTGKAGASRASGYERAGFARNSKVLHGWTRAQINIAPGAADSNETLVLSCGKNSNGREFPAFAVQLDPSTMIYEPDDMFDMEGWREEINGKGPSAKKRYEPSLVPEVLGNRSMDKAGLVNDLKTKAGCGQSKAYELIAEAEESQLIQRNRKTNLYAKGR